MSDNLPSFNDLRRKGGDLVAAGSGLVFRAHKDADPDAYEFALAAVAARIERFRVGWTLARTATRGQCPRCGGETNYWIDNECPLCRSATRRLARTV